MVLNSCAAVLTKKLILSVELYQIFTTNVLVHEKYIASSHKFFFSFTSFYSEIWKLLTGKGTFGTIMLSMSEAGSILVELEILRLRTTTISALKLTLANKLIYVHSKQAKKAIRNEAVASILFIMNF